jgi:hypothetical protein
MSYLLPILSRHAPTLPICFSYLQLFSDNMRKLRLQINISIDGFISGQTGELDWISQEMDIRQLERLQALTDGMDTIIMGRKMAAGFTSYLGECGGQPARQSRISLR